MECLEEVKDEFWEMVDETMGKIPRVEGVWIGGDLNGHVCGGNAGEKVFMGCFELETRKET